MKSFFLVSLLVISFVSLTEPACASTELCAKLNLAELRAVPDGFQCESSQGVNFRMIRRAKPDDEIPDVSYANALKQSSNMVWKDLKSGLIFTSFILAHVAYNSSACAEDWTLYARASIPNSSWHMATGYPTSFNQNFGGTSSDLAQLEVDGFQEVSQTFGLIKSSTLLPSSNNKVFYCHSQYGEGQRDVTSDDINGALFSRVEFYNSGVGFMCIGN